MVMHTDSYITLAFEDVWMGIALCFVVLRLYVRCWLQSKFDCADGFIVGAWLCFFSNIVIDRASWRRDGLGIMWNAGIVGSSIPNFREVFNYDDELLIRALKVVYINFVPYLFTLFFVKFAFCQLYYDLIPPSMGRLRKGLNAVTIFTVLSFVGCVFLNMLWCFPLSKNWEVEKEKACYTVFELTPWFITAALHILTDLAIYAIPFFLLPSLRASRRVNRTSLLGVTVMFSLGGICVAITLARMICTGFDGDISSVALFQSAEYASGIIVACCPPLKWLWVSMRAHGIRAKKGTYTETVTTFVTPGNTTGGEARRSGAPHRGTNTDDPERGEWTELEDRNENRRKRRTLSIIAANHANSGPHLIIH